MPLPSPLPKTPAFSEKRFGQFSTASGPQPQWPWNGGGKEKLKPTVVKPALK